MELYCNFYKYRTYEVPVTTERIKMIPDKNVFEVISTIEKILATYCLN